jgi:hypothetical protein
MMKESEKEFHVEHTPKPAYVLRSVCVKHSSHWSYDESEKAFLSGDLTSFLVCTQVHIRSSFFYHICLHVKHK